MLSLVIIAFKKLLDSEIAYVHFYKMDYFLELDFNWLSVEILKENVF